ncbi:DHS-like NAD/FAD-binding domain-containing protein [Jimgerdemannia flammicorona]|uniref:DHS-like NAD/FAD-binding domain-containing protein n=2 Tax=Jimgerdemannia flammicorona TaxID=994334 RepID=A0A433QD86_9FUNG|nr:DHS-like NAD/FAD-binding domain-containing protein [Jimgerdemannia flammicorona]RUS27753.1 DHS-like NAD/FAD-binding domain-containing protein [Jimgerdemannia flammicorona]
MVLRPLAPATMPTLRFSTIPRPLLVRCLHEHTLLHPRIPVLRTKVRPSLLLPIAPTPGLEFITEVEPAIRAVADLLKDSGGKVVVLTGAGVSTDSGIPDYRGEKGAYAVNANYKPIYFQEFVSIHPFRQRYWARGYLGWSQIQHAHPNATHHSLASLHRAGLISHLITQNVDRLHQAAGSLPDHTTELHGTLHEVHCLSCSHTVSRDEFQATLAQMNPDWAQWAAGLEQSGTRPQTNPDGDVELPASISYAGFAYPSCGSCGTGVMKPSVVFFGENIHPRVKQVSFQAVERSKAVLVVGSSLATYSAFRLVKVAKELGKQVGIVNLGVTRGDSIADFKVDLGCALVFSGVQRMLDGGVGSS